VLSSSTLQHTTPMSTSSVSGGTCESCLKQLTTLNFVIQDSDVDVICSRCCLFLLSVCDVPQILLVRTEYLLIRPSDHLSLLQKRPHVLCSLSHTNFRARLRLRSAKLNFQVRTWVPANGWCACKSPPADAQADPIRHQLRHIFDGVRDNLLLIHRFLYDCRVPWSVSHHDFLWIFPIFPIFHFFYLCRVLCQ
jgi:hypothetical protein